MQFFKSDSLLSLMWLLALSGFTFSAMAQPAINQVTPNLAQVGQYEKFELALDLSASYTNAYDYDQIAVLTRFTAPSGSELVVDGFFAEGFSLNANGSLSPTGNDGFFVRFSPMETGTWTYQVSVETPNGTVMDSLRTFDCVASVIPENKGFVRTTSTHYLAFDNGDPYVPIGENVAWQTQNPYLDYSLWLGNMADNSGNYFRLWHAHWGLGIEWENGWNGFLGLRRYKESNSRYQDWLFDYCAEKGIYVMLCIQHHGQVSSQVNPNWSDSPYNTVNGGPCANTWEFFTNAAARAHTRNRIRYIVARWGYSRSIMAWELFNEVDWTDDYETHQADVRNWHDEMAGYLRQIDPYGHLITTSFSRDDYDPLVWTSPDMDLTQTHYYLDTPNLERLLVGGVRSYRQLYDKPTLSGEFGLGPTPPATGVDPDGIHIHNGLWGALYGGGVGTAMSWWWDSYIEPEDLYYHFESVAAVAEDMPFLTKNMAPAESYVAGAPGDLSLTPSLDWGIIAEDSIGIGQGGVITPEDPDLSRYLYGSTWNTQYRSPPTFYVDYPLAGTFTVTTGTTTGAAPQIAIWLDGALVLQQSANQISSYSINVPAGAHSIKVDNTGTDWITIGSYEFTGLGSKVDAYTLLAADGTVAAAWVLNNRYNHQVVPVSGAPAVVAGAELVIDGIAADTYYAKWYNCLTGDVIALQEIIAAGDSATVPIPDLHWDLALRLDTEIVNPTSVAEIQAQTFRLFPNPVQSGQAVILEASLDQVRKPALLDAAGRQLSRLSVTSIGGNQWQLEMPGDLSEGYYWLRIESEHGAVAKPFLIRR